MDDDLDDYKLDTTWHQDPSHVVHISFERDHRRKGRKVRVENKWYRRRELGVGSCSVVHLETTDDGRERAVKSIRKSFAERLRIDYKRELAAISTFSKAKYQQHQIFVEFLGWFENTEFIFLAMEHLPLGDLSKHISEDIREHDLKDISSQLLEGLKLMHSKGFTHRDLKPQNIFIVQKQPSWWVKIGDFGIAKRVRDCDATELRTATGTQGYEAPEIRGYVEVDEHSPSSVYTNLVDIWSFGCVIYKIVAKHVPFQNGREIKRFCDSKSFLPTQPLQGKLTTDGIDFLRSILVARPNDRLTAHVALQHPWLLNDDEYGESSPETETGSVKKEELSGPLEAEDEDHADRGYVDQQNLDNRVQSSEDEGKSEESLEGRGRLDATMHNPGNNTRPAKETEKEGDMARSARPREMLRRSVPKDLQESEPLTTIMSAQSLKINGDSAMTANRYPAAINFYTKALALFPGNPVLLSNRAAAYTLSYYNDFALADAEAAVKAGPRYSTGWARLGFLRYRLGDPKGSVEAYQKAIEFDGNGGSDLMKKGYETAKERVAQLESGRENHIMGKLTAEPLDYTLWIEESHGTGLHPSPSLSSPDTLQTSPAATKVKKKQRKSFFGKLKERFR